MAAHRLPTAPARNRQRGAMLIVAMLLAAVIGISLVSYIRLSLNSMTLADRTFYQNAAVNFAEMALEEALYCYNQLDENSSSPTNAWTASGTGITWGIHSTDGSVTATLPSTTLGPGVTGTAKIYCTHYNPSGTNPYVTVRSVVTLQKGPTLEKWLQVQLRKRSLWANGLVARNGQVWNGGNTTADSFNSDPDNNPSTPAVAYSSSTARANATVGTPATGNGAMDIGGGTIRGAVMTGGGSVSHSSGAILSDTLTGTGWNANLVSNDFSATFPAVTVPAPPSGSKNLVNSSHPISFPSTLPASGHVAWNGVYYYELASGYSVSSSGNASKILTINGPVVFIATGNSGTNTIDLGGNASIRINANASLKVYTNGNVEAAGNGVANSNASASSFQVYGTHTSAGGQTIRFVGNGSTTGAIYAPNATFELRGNGSLAGAVVANTINLNGNAAFHYDEALGNVATGNPFGIVEWKELQSISERNSANSISHSQSVSSNWLKP